MVGVLDQKVSLSERVKRLISFLKIRPALIAVDDACVLSNGPEGPLFLIHRGECFSFEDLSSEDMQRVTSPIFLEKVQKKLQCLSKSIGMGY